jgi:hypothetical protein
MAKKRKKGGAKKRRYSTKRRRGGIGSLGGVNVTQGLSALGGALAGRVVTQGMKNLEFIKEQKMKDIARFGAKGILSYVLMSRKSPEVEAAGFGMAAELALDIADTYFGNVFGADTAKTSGIGATVIDLDNVSGIDDYTVAGYDDLSVAGVV